MYFILFLLQLGQSDFHRGGYLFTETIKGTCDFSRSSSYIYTYNDLGGASLDSALSIGFGFWMNFDTSKQEYLYNNTYAFFMSDNVNSYTFRLMSFSLKKYGINSTMELFQQDSAVKQGPSTTINMEDTLDDKWRFIYVSYDFLFLKYQLGVFDVDGTVLLNTSYSCPSQLKYCTTTTLPQPFLKRQNLTLYVGWNGPYRNDTVKGRTWCGSLAGFQYYLDLRMVSDANLYSLMYGFDKTDDFLNYPLLQFSGNELYEQNSMNVLHDITSDWTEQALNIVQPLQIELPLIRFLYGRFVISFWLKMNSGINFAILQRMVDGVIMFELDIIYYAISSYFYFQITREGISTNLDVHFNPDEWNHFILLFSYDKVSYETGVQQRIRIYKNNDNVYDLQTTQLVYNTPQDSDTLVFGKRDSIPASKSIKISNLQFHQGSRVFNHQNKDAGDAKCLYSASKRFQYICLICQDGYYLQNNECVSAVDCLSGIFDNSRKLCLPKCDSKCLTCSTSTVCQSCVNNLQLNAGVCSCPNQGYIGNGNQLKCKEFDYIGQTEIGTVDAILSYVTTGNGHRQDVMQVYFKDEFTNIPQVVVAFTKISISTGNSYKIMATQVTQDTFVLQIEAWSDTIINSISVNYFATTQTDLIVLNQLDIDTTNTFSIASGNRVHQVQLLLSEWDMRLQYPTVLPYFNGLQLIQGTTNITITYTTQIDKINQFINVLFNIQGDIQISQIYYSFIMIPSKFEILNVKFNSKLSKLWIAQTGNQKQNQTNYKFTNQQDYFFYGISNVGYQNSLTKTFIIQNEQYSSIEYIMKLLTYDDTVIDLIELNLFGININCQTYGCKQCGLSPVDCLICKDNTLDKLQQCLNCDNTEYLDSNFSCQKCKWNCLTCQNNEDECLTCKTGVFRYNDPANKCSCQNGYFDNGVELCVQCDWRCEKCQTTSTTCSECKGANRNSNDACKCSDQFYEVGTDPICKNCLEPCDLCDVNGCLTCLGNRVLDGTKQCICPSASLPIPKSQYCETCDTVEVFITLNQNSESLSVFFVKSNTSYVIKEYQNLKPIDLCPKIISGSQFSRFGTNPLCYYNGTNIDISFGTDAKVNIMEEISLQSGVFLKDSCDKAIKNYIINTLQLPSEQIFLPQFVIDGPKYPQFICKSITLNIIDLQYSGKRSLSKILWKLADSDAEQNVIDSVNKALEEVNSDNADTVTFRSLLFSNFTNYTFEVTGTSFAAKVNTISYKLQTIGLVQPYISADIITFKHFYSQQLIIPLTVYYEYCQSSKITQKYDNLTLSWVQAESIPVNSKQLIPDTIVETITDTVHYFKLNSYSGYPDTQYIIQAQLMYVDIIEIIDESNTDTTNTDSTTTDSTDTTNTDTSNTDTTNTDTSNTDTSNTDTSNTDTSNTDTPTPTPVHNYKNIEIYSYLNFTINIDYVGLGVIIEGGDRFISEGESVVLEALFWDGLDEGSQYNSDSEIGLKWECISVLTSSACQLNDGTQQVFDENVTSITIDGEIFKLGQQYQISVLAYKDIRQYQYSCNIICSFKSIDVLQPTYPISIQTRYIDINQEITFTFVPNINLIDTYNYTIIILYDDQEILKSALNYPQITLKLKNYLPNSLSLDQCYIEILQQSLSFYQMAVLPIKFNIPPQNAYLQVSSYSGVSIETLFNITVLGATDEDLPLQYRLSLYPSQYHYQYDIKHSTNLYQIILVEYQYSNYFSTILPSGFLFDFSQCPYVQLMVTIKDSRGATSNITLQIGNSPQFRLYKAFLITVSDFKYTVTSQTENKNVIAAAVEALSFYHETYVNNLNASDLAITMQNIQTKLKSLRFNDTDAQYSTNKLISYFDQSMYQLLILNSTQQQSVLYLQLQKIIDNAFVYKTKLLNAQQLTTKREQYGDLTSQIDMDNIQFQMTDLLNQFSAILAQKINSTKLNQSYSLLTNTTLQKWRLNHTSEALAMDSLEEDEKINGMTIQYQLDKYNNVVKYIQPYTVQEIFEFSNVTLESTLNEISAQFNYTLSILSKITEGLSKFCKINDPPIEYNSSLVSIRLQLLTSKYFKNQYNLQSSTRLLNSMNSTSNYLIVVHSYKINPYMTDDDFFNYTGTYAFDIQFPVYAPFIYEIQNKENFIQIDQLNNNQFAIDFLLPNETLPLINQYQCAQKQTKWRSDDSNCSRTVEYLSDIRQFKLWCICPYYSETTILRPFYVEEAALLKPKILGITNVMDFVMGQYIVGLTGGILLLMLIGMVIDNKNAEAIKLENERMENERIEIIFQHRLRRRRDEDQHDSKTFIPDSKHFHSQSTQTEPQPVQFNADIGIQDISAKLILVGMIKIQEILSIFLYYDEHTPRSIRFLAVYLKLIVMLSVSGVLLSQADSIKQYIIIWLASEIASLVVKIVKAIFSGKLIQMVTGSIVSVGILALSYYSIINNAFGQEEYKLIEWLQFYGLCVGVYFVVLDPLQCILKLLLYPWCRKQIETEQETPILHLIYFLITQGDLIAYYKIHKERQEIIDEDEIKSEKRVTEENVI